MSSASPVDPSVEAALVRAAAGGDVAAFNELVVRYQDAVYTLCYRLTGHTSDAEDATQDAFLAAFRHLTELRGDGFRSWLLRIAANTCYDLHRRHRRRPTEPLLFESEEGGATAEPGDPSPGPEEAALRQEMHEGLQRALLTLPEDQRLAVVLCDLYGYDYQGIASLAGVELGTVKSRINRGRRRLRDYLLAHRELLPATYRLTEGES